LLQSLVDEYRSNLGLSIERSENNNLLIIFENLSQSTIPERCIVELGIKEDDEDSFESNKKFQELTFSC